jgi:hypothetical protein
VENNKLILPDIFIAGVPKAGTSSLFVWLADHPSVEGSKPKETGFFNNNDSELCHPKYNFFNGIENFSYFFSTSNHSRLRLEASPSNIYNQVARKAIASMSHRPKVIFILREPSEFLFSFFRFLKNNIARLGSDMDFLAFIENARKVGMELNPVKYDVIAEAKYVDFLKLWKSVLDSDQLKIYLYEDMKRNPHEFMRKICLDLSIDPAFYDDYDFKTKNKTFHVRIPFIYRIYKNGKFKNKLKRFFPKTLRVFLRSIFLLITTSKAKEKSKEEKILLKSLKEEFREKNAELAKEFGLDLSSWD